MAKRLELSEEQLSEIKAARKANKNKNIENRLHAIELHGEKFARKDIALQTGFSLDHIGKLVKKYLSGGLSAVAENNYTGNRRLLSFEEESKLLSRFMRDAEAGKMVDVSEIKATYEQAIGRELNSHGHIYEVLKRHNFRKVMPRSKHPNKASDAVIRNAKKLKQLAED